MGPKTFGFAIEMLKEGKKVARSGWNGKGMYVYLEDTFVFPSKLSKELNPAMKRQYDPCFIMFTAQKTHQPGWLASQADMLADDWVVVG